MCCQLKWNSWWEVTSSSLGCPAAKEGLRTRLLFVSVCLDIRYILSYFLFLRKREWFLFRVSEHDTIKAWLVRERSKVVLIALGDRKPQWGQDSPGRTQQGSRGVMVTFMCQLDPDTGCPVIGETLFYVCTWRHFWMRWTFESVAGIKQFALFSVVGPHPNHWRPE